MPGRCQRRSHSLAAHAQPTEASADAEAAGRAGRAADHHRRDAHQTIKKFHSTLFMSCKVLKGCCVAAHRSCWRAGCAVEHLCGVRQNVMGITFHVFLLFCFNAIQNVCASGVQELLAALDVQQTTISAAHMRVGQQLKQLQVLAFLVLSFCLFLHCGGSGGARSKCSSGGTSSNKSFGDACAVCTGFAGSPDAVPVPEELRQMPLT